MRYLACLLCLPALAPAQNISCALSGTVQDAGGAVIAGASIRLTGEDNGFVRSATTNNEGFFSFPDLTPATFTLAVEAPGFKHYSQTGIEINASEQRSLGQVRLEVGQVSDSVTVTADAATVNLATGERSGTLTSDSLEHLALRGRDIFDAISLMPGVVDTSDGRDAPGPTSIGNIYIAGGRNDSKNMMVDGVTNLDTGSNGSIHTTPSMDSVAEVKVLMSAYSAEYGRNPTSINVITKGGGKAFHGGAYYFFRNEDLNANDYFNNEAGRPRTEYRYNIFGFTIGGPVIIPKINRNRDKLFFFYSQEFQDQVVQYGTKEVTVPTALERAGNFSQSFDVNNPPKLKPISDPLNGNKAFPGNILPASRITPVGQAILNLFPLPNFVDPNPVNRYQWNYFSSDAGAYPRRTETGRVDYSPKNNWQLYARLSNNSDHQNTPYGLWVDGSLNFPLTPIVFAEPGRDATLHSTNTISPTLFNELIVGASQNTLTFSPLDPSAVNRTTLGILIPQRNPALNPGNIIPDMSFSGIANPANPSLNDGTPYFNQNNIFILSDNVSKIAGTHTVKTGIYFEHTQKLQSASSVTRGSIAFGTDANNTTTDTKDAYANALLGFYDTYSEATARPQGNYIFTNTEIYLQDTWRVRGNLSLDYGIRFYHDPPQYDTRDQLASFSTGLYNAATAPVLLRPGFDSNKVKVAVDPLTGTTYPSGLIGDFVPGVGNPADGSFVGGKNGFPQGLYTVAPVDVAPRFGFAWDPFRDGRTAVRGGGGIFFDRIEGNPIMGQIVNPPIIFTPLQYYGTFSDIAASASSGLLSPTGSITSLAGQGHQQTVYNFNLEVQRQIGRSMVAQVGYVGSLARHLLWERNINAVPLGSTFISKNPQNHDPTSTSATTALPTNFLRPYQGLGDVLLYEFAGTSNYHALQAGVMQRFSHGLRFGGNYTFGKVLDESDLYSQAVDPFVSPRERNYGPAGFNRTNVFSANYTWTVPKPGAGIQFRPAHWIGDNWEIAGVTRMQSGGPVSPTYSLVSSNAAFDGSGSPSDTARVSVGTNPNAPLATRFAPPAPGTIGNSGRDIIVGPGTNNWDMSLYKYIHISERVMGQLRFESYNTFNHTQFSVIDVSTKFQNSSSTAQINSLFLHPTTARPPRRIQIALRVTF